MALVSAGRETVLSGSSAAKSFEALRPVSRRGPASRLLVAGVVAALCCLLTMAVSAEAISVGSKLAFELQEGDGVVSGGAEGTGGLTGGSAEVRSVVTLRKAFVVG